MKEDFETVVTVAHLMFLDKTIGSSEIATKISELFAELKKRHVSRCIEDMMATYERAAKISST